MLYKTLIDYQNVTDALRFAIVGVQCHHPGNRTTHARSFIHTGSHALPHSAFRRFLVGVVVKDRGITQIV